MSTNYLGPNVHGIASPAAAVPEGALPPLPKSHHKAGDFDSYADVYEPHEVQHIVRAAVEADRAQRPGHLEASKTAETRVDSGFEGGLLADRAQQGEPVYQVQLADEGGAWRDISEVAYSNANPERRRIVYHAATKAAAPADAPTVAGFRLVIDPNMPPDAIEMLGANRVRANLRTGEITEVAIPDTGIPNAGEVESTVVQDAVDLFAACGFEVRPDNPQFAVVGSLDAAGVLVNAVIEHFQAGAERFDWSRKGMVLDPQGFYVHYRRSDDLNLSGRAPVSGTPTSGAVEKAESDAGAVNYTVGRNHCDCHPETCCCDPWAIFGRGGKKHSTHFARSTADEIAAALNKSAAPHPSEAPTCTCPSGDGSLRWPCPVHPSEAKAGEDA